MTREEAINQLEINKEDDTYVIDDEALDMAIKALEQEPRWIPISERLPEEREWKGTKRFGTTISDEVYVTLETSDGERFTKHLRFQNGELSQIDQETMRMWYKEAVPIAWMPKPKPYEPPAKSEEQMTYGYCAYHETECDYKGSCSECLHNTQEDAEWFKQEEQAESEG